MVPVQGSSAEFGTEQGFLVRAEPLVAVRHGGVGVTRQQHRAIGVAMHGIEATQSAVGGKRVVEEALREIVGVEGERGLPGGRILRRGRCHGG